MDTWEAFEASLVASASSSSSSSSYAPLPDADFLDKMIANGEALRDLLRDKGDNVGTAGPASRLQRVRVPLKQKLSKMADGMTFGQRVMNSRTSSSSLATQRVLLQARIDKATADADARAGTSDSALSALDKMNRKLERMQITQSDDLETPEHDLQALVASLAEEARLFKDGDDWQTLHEHNVAEIRRVYKDERSRTCIESNPGLGEQLVGVLDLSLTHKCSEPGVDDLKQKLFSGNIQSCTELLEVAEKYEDVLQKHPALKDTVASMAKELSGESGTQAIGMAFKVGKKAVDKVRENPDLVEKAKKAIGDLFSDDEETNA